MPEYSHFNRRSAIGAALTAPITLSGPEIAVARAQIDQMIAIHNVLSSYALAWQRGDSDTLVALYHDDFTLHYPGHHALAGVHKSKPEALRILKEVSARTRRQLLEIVDVMAGSRRGCLNVRERWTRENEVVVVERAFVYTVREGKLDNCWLFDADQSIVERFFNAP